jgi:hypothetical protein
MRLASLKSLYFVIASLVISLYFGLAGSYARPSFTAQAQPIDLRSTDAGSSMGSCQNARVRNTPAQLPATHPNAIDRTYEVVTDGSGGLLSICYLYDSYGGVEYFQPGFIVAQHAGQVITPATKAPVVRLSSSDPSPIYGALRRSLELQGQLGDGVLPTDAPYRSLSSATKFVLLRC